MSKPGDWRYLRLSDVAPPASSKVRFPPVDVVWHLSLDQIASNTGDISGKKMAPASKAGTSTYVFDKGNVLYSKLRPYLNKVVCPAEPGIATSELVPLRPRSDLIDRHFLAYYLRSPGFLSFATSSVAGVKMPRIIMDKLWEHPVPVPPLAEQRRIVEILDQADALRKKRAEADAKAARILPALFYEMFGDPKQNLQGLPIIRVGEAGKVQLGRQRAPKYQTGKFTRPYVRVANVFEDRIDVSDLLSMDFDEKDFIQYKLQSGDILLNEGQSTELVGRPAMWRNEVPECCFQNTLIRFQADRGRVLPEYALAYFLVCFRGSEFAKISGKTSSVAHLGASRFAAMPFPLPSLRLQKEFATRATEIRAIEMREAGNRQRIEDLATSLLYRAFAGSLTAKWQDAESAR